MHTRRQHLAGLAGVAAAALAGPLVGWSGFVEAAPSTSRFVPVAPTRIADTRERFGMSPTSRMSAKSTSTVQVTGRAEVDIPDDAVAVVVNVVAVGPVSNGYLTVWPTGTSRPTTSVLNYEPGTNRANLVTCRVGTGGKVSVFSPAPVHVVVDVVGYYEAVSEATEGRIVPTGPARSYDSRDRSKFRAGELRTISLSRQIPDGASAAILNVTGLNTTRPVFVTVLPASANEDDEITTATVNIGTRGVAGNQTIVPLIGNSREIKVYASAACNVVIDVFGYVTGERAPLSSDGLFVALPSPRRVLDTRTALNPLGATIRLWPGWTLEQPIGGVAGIPNRGVAGVVGNMTMVDTHGAGYLTAYPAGRGRPLTASANSDHAGAVVGNHQMVPITNRGVSIYGDKGSHVVLDVAGYLTGETPVVQGSPVRVQTMPEPVFPMRLNVPAIGFDAPVGGNTSSAVIDGGLPGWLVTTSYPGKPGAMYVFAHRTDAGGPFRNLHLLRPGDRMSLHGATRDAVYEVTGWRVVSEAQLDSDAEGANLDPDGLVLVACSQPNGLPTSLAYRIRVTGKLISLTNR